MPDANKYQRDWYAHIRRDWFKQHGPCAHCGSWENLQADHIDPKTKDPKASKRVPWSWSKARREIELAKCQALCKPCHLKKSSEEKRGEGNGRAKLRKIDVALIRYRYHRMGHTQQHIANDYGCSTSNVKYIVNYKTWK